HSAALGRICNAGTRLHHRCVHPQNACNVAWDHSRPVFCRRRANAFPVDAGLWLGISPIFGLARAEHVYLADGSAGSSNLCAKRGSVLRVSRGSARVDRESCVETEKDGGPVPEQAQLPSPIGDVWISPSARRIRLRFQWTARSRQGGTARDRDIVFRPVTEMPQAAQFCCFFLKKAVSCSGSVLNVMPCRAAILSQILAS